MSNNCIYEKSLKLDEVEDLTEFLAEQLNLGGVLFINGDLGTGKTTLIKDLVKKLGSQDEVSSPSYSIINHYESEEFTIFHMDLYRMKDLEELVDIGIEEYFNQNAVCIVEWPDLLHGLVQADYLVEIIAQQPESRLYRVLDLNRNLS